MTAFTDSPFLAAVHNAVTEPGSSIGALTGIASRPLSSMACTASGCVMSDGVVTSNCHPEPQRELTAARLPPQVLRTVAGVAVGAGKDPLPLVVAVPRGAGKERRHGGAACGSGQQPAEEVAATAVEGDQRSLIELPGIVAGTAIERRRRL